LNIEWFKYEIAKILKTLSKNEAEIIKLFFGLNGYSEMSHQEIAEKLWKSTERIRQIKNEAIKKMKYKSKLLKKYLW
jgi:RNA polymerase primary sigma factor